MALWSDACAVIRMTGVSGSCARTADRISMPVTPGIFTSVRTMSGAEPLSCSRPALPPCAVVTSNPSFLSRIRRVSRIPCSSSITRMDGAGEGVISGSLLFAAGGREVHGEGRALPRRAVHEHQPAVRLYRALYDGEAEAGAPHSSRCEGLEQTALQLLGDTGAVVADAQGHRVLDPGPAGKLVRRRPARPHHDGGALTRRLDGVQDEVRDDAVQQVLVALHRRRAALELDARVRGAVGVLAHDADRRLGHLVEVHGAGLGHPHP